MADMTATRQLLSRHLVGSGVELGPGEQPFPMMFVGTDVRYVDRWVPDENRSLFPEVVGEDFPEPDIICNLDTDRLKMLEDDSEDFVVASHVLEHVADPIGLLDEIHRVVRPGGTALILLPDRRRTFDKDRAPTPLDHLVTEFERQITEVDDDHILDFIEYVAPEEFAHYGTLDAEGRAEIIDLHRRRSVHVHCWHEEEFLEVLLYAISDLGHTWALVEGLIADDEGETGFEFGYVLRKSPDETSTADVRRQRFADAWALFAQQRRQHHDAAQAVARELAAEQARAVERANEVEQLRRDLAAALTPPPWKETVVDLSRRAGRRLVRRPADSGAEPGS
jgi:SAM-dependent methyltransferase